MKMLFYDLETTPNVGYTWGKWEQNVIDFQKEWELLSFAYKFKGHPAIVARDRSTLSEKALVQSLHNILSSADVLVAHNGKAFDNKKANAKFIQFGLKPLPPIPTIDTRDEARRHFKFNSNKLDDLGKLLGLGRKIRIAEGFDLWLKCMAGNKKAFATMARYNKQDVVLLEKVYNKLAPWIKHPATHTEGCTKCGSLKLQRRGTQTTTSSIYQRFQCMVCGGWFRNRVSEQSIKPSKVGL